MYAVIENILFKAAFKLFIKVREQCISNILEKALQKVELMRD